MMTILSADFRRSLYAVVRRVALGRALRDLRSTPRGETPSRAALTRLRATWGNPGYTASVSYLEAVAARTVRADGPILECGSGLSTLLIAVLTQSRDLGVWSLEHDFRWVEIIRKDLRSLRVRGVEVCYAPLRSYGGFTWYEVPLHRLPSTFSLVVCDGPPNTTPGGRYGLVPVLGDRLAPSWNILLDDAKAAKRTGTLDRWMAMAGVSAELRDNEDGSYLWITRAPAIFDCEDRAGGDTTSSAPGHPA